MKKTVLILAVSILMTAGSAFAGDLDVNGNLTVDGTVGVGTSTPGAKLDVQSTDEAALVVNATRSSETVGGNNFLTGSSINLDMSSALVRGKALNLQVTHTDTVPASGYPGTLSAAGYRTVLRGSGHLGYGVTGMMSQLAFATYAGNYTIPKVTGVATTMGAGYQVDPNSQHYVENYIGFQSTGSFMKGQYSGDNWKHAYFGDFNFIDPDNGNDNLISMNSVTGLWIDKQTAASPASSNRGIVLNGDDTGADIVFGEYNGTRPRIYSNTGRLYVQDSAGNQTIISPHDPETGEWVYYSENVKTGEVVRVDMERLVKAVEKLTGEKFLIKTVKEVK